MADKYPEFYIRKRQKEDAYRRTVQIVVGVAIFALIGGVGGFFGYKYWLQPRRQPAPAPEQLSDERQNLETQRALADAASQRPEAAGELGQIAANSQLGVDLNDIPYDPSFPLVQVGIEGSNTGVALEGMQAEDEAAEANPEPAETGQLPTAPPSDRDQPDTFQRPTAEGGPTGDTAGSNTSDSSEAASGDDSGQETASPETPKPPADEPAAGADDNPESSAENVFHVYAGTYTTREEAEAAKSDLQALGFQSQIIDVNIEFHVKVASMDDFDRARAIKDKLVESGFTKAFATRSRQ